MQCQTKGEPPCVLLCTVLPILLWLLQAVECQDLHHLLRRQSSFNYTNTSRSTYYPPGLSSSLFLPSVPLLQTPTTPISSTTSTTTNTPAPSRYYNNSQLSTESHPPPPHLPPATKVSSTHLDPSSIYTPTPGLGAIIYSQYVSSEVPPPPPQRQNSRQKGRKDVTEGLPLEEGDTGSPSSSSTAIYSLKTSEWTSIRDYQYQTTDPLLPSYTESIISPSLASFINIHPSSNIIYPSSTSIYPSTYQKPPIASFHTTASPPSLPNLELSSSYKNSDSSPSDHHKPLLPSSSYTPFIDSIPTYTQTIAPNEDIPLEITSAHHQDILPSTHKELLSINPTSSSQFRSDLSESMDHASVSLQISMTQTYDQSLKSQTVTDSSIGDIDSNLVPTINGSADNRNVFGYSEATPSGEPWNHTSVLPPGVDEGSIGVGGIVGITLACSVILLAGLTIGIALYHRTKSRQLDTTKAPSNHYTGLWDDSVTLSYINNHFDFFQRDVQDEMVSLDNDAYLNSLEFMVFTNTWGDGKRNTRF